MLDLKACPRCRGDLNTRQDIYGEYQECLQCGYMKDIETPSALFPVPASAQREKKQVA